MPAGGGRPSWGRGRRLLAIDLYDLVYRGGPHSPYELNERFANTCGIFAHEAIAPTKALFAAARSAGIPVFYCTQDTRPNNRPPGAVSTRRQRPTPTDDPHAIYREFTPQPEDIVIYKQRASAFAGTPMFSHLALLGIQSLIVCGESTSGCVRASVVDAYSNGFHVTIVEQCTFDRSALHPQGQPVRPASQICRRDASRRGRRRISTACAWAGRRNKRGIADRDDDADRKTPAGPAAASLLLAAAAGGERARGGAGAGRRPPVSFAGKQIRLFVGFSPTGFGYDTYGRLLARHLGQLSSGPAERGRV